MIEDRIFLNSRYEQFKDGENEQWYFDELIKTIYSVLKMQNGAISRNNGNRRGRG